MNLTRAGVVQWTYWQTTSLHYIVKSKPRFVRPNSRVEPRRPRRTGLVQSIEEIQSRRCRYFISTREHSWLTLSCPFHMSGLVSQFTSFLLSTIILTTTNLLRGMSDLLTYLLIAYTDQLHRRTGLVTDFPIRPRSLLTPLTTTEDSPMEGLSSRSPRTSTAFYTKNPGTSGVKDSGRRRGDDLVFRGLTTGTF